MTEYPYRADLPVVGQIFPVPSEEVVLARAVATPDRIFSLSLRQPDWQAVLAGETILEIYHRGGWRPALSRTADAKLTACFAPAQTFAASLLPQPKTWPAGVGRRVYKGLSSLPGQVKILLRQFEQLVLPTAPRPVRRGPAALAALLWPFKRPFPCECSGRNSMWPISSGSPW